MLRPLVAGSLVGFLSVTILLGQQKKAAMSASRVLEGTAVRIEEFPAGLDVQVEKGNDIYEFGLRKPFTDVQKKEWDEVLAKLRKGDRVTVTYTGDLIENHGIFWGDALAIRSVGPTSTGLGLLSVRPSSVVKRYYDLGQKGQMEEVVKLFSPEVLSALRGAGIDPRTSLGGYFQDISTKGGITALTVEDDSVQGDTAYVRIAIRFGNGTADQGRERLKRFGGNWLLAPPTAAEQFGR